MRKPESDLTLALIIAVAIIDAILIGIIRVQMHQVPPAVSQRHRS